MLTSRRLIRVKPQWSYSAESETYRRFKKLGDVEIIARSQGIRWDRTYLPMRVWLVPELPQISHETEASPSAAVIRELSQDKQPTPRWR